jgi:DNA polymerase-3 subunit delta'
MGRGQFFVVEQAELMNPHAQNAMLKTLEEPYGRTMIVLLTDQPDCLLPTIRSRCQLIRFAAMDAAVVRRELEKRGIAKPQAADAAKFSQGSLGLALKWIEDGVINFARELAQRIDSLLNGRAPADLPQFFKAAADAYAEKQLLRDELGSKDQATKEAYALYLSLAANRVRERLGESNDADELDRAANAIEVIARAEANLDANVNVALTFQQLAVALEREFAPAH